MDKKYWHHWKMRIKVVKVWYLMAAFLVSVTVCAFALRDNNLHMEALRNEVYRADQSGGNVEQALQNLRSYVLGHMNTSLASSTDAVYPPIQLKYTYERLQKAEQMRVDQANDRVYTDAQNYCERLYPSSFSGGPRVPCIEQYVDQHGAKASVIPDSLYKFDFISPNWSPDLAGWTLVASFLFLGLALIRFILGRFLP